MICEQDHCSSNSFSTCKNHCMKQLCLEHLIEHEDMFLNRYENLLNQLEKSNNQLINEIKKTNVKITQHRNHELERIKTSYSIEENQFEQQYAFLKQAQQLYEVKNEQFKKSSQEKQCFINQHDFQQIKAYHEQLKDLLDRKSVV